MIGETGWVGALAAVTGRDRAAVEAGLRGLQRREFLRQVRVASVADETEYTFRHTLIREVAYQQLVRAERAEKHERVAHWLHHLNPDVVERADLLAYHYSRALELTRISAQPDPALITRARLACQAAGDRATGLSAFTAAADYYRRALAVWSPDDPALPELHIQLGQALLLSRQSSQELLRASAMARKAGRDDLAIEADILLRFLARDPDGGGSSAGASPGAQRRSLQPLKEQTGSPDVRVAAAATGSRALELLVASRHTEALAVAEELVALACTHGLPHYEGLGLALGGDARIRCGDPTGQARFWEGMRIMEACRFPRRIWAYFGHARSLWIHGDLPGCAAALVQARRALGTAEAIKDWVDVLGAGLDHAAGRWDRALEVTDRVLASEPAHQERFPVAWSLVLRARIRLARGEPCGALADARAAVACDELRLQQEARAVLGRALLATQDPDAAAHCAAQLLAEQHQQPETATVTPDLVRLLADLEDPPAGALPERLPPTSWHRAAQAFHARRYRQAAELLDGIGSPVDAAHARLRLARTLTIVGEDAEAHAALAAATAVFQQAGAPVELEIAAPLRSGRPAGA